MTDLVRQEIMTAADTVVVKVGSRVLTREDGALDDTRVAAVADQLARLRLDGRKVVLVSSGAVAAGIGRLGWKRRPTDLAELQAAAAVGQSRLIESYNKALGPHGLNAAQILLTAEDLQHRTRYLNTRNTLNALFRCGAIPIINENDTVAVDELQISFGDNDRLAALVTNLLRAPLMILLSDVEGVYDRNPSEPGAKLMSVITHLDAADSYAKDAVGPARIQLSRGGMGSKLRAARIAAAAGESVVIAAGRRPNVLLDILAGAEVGTLILAEGRTVASRKRWIGWSATPRGKLLLDAGAAKAVQSNGKSLLAVGVRGVEGNFVKGDVVSICDPAGREFARGLSNYTSTQMTTIAGQPTDRIAELLGHCPYDEVVHRDNLVVLT
ncbi:glutamate 5-kinase [Lacipirellula limnantheis]|uniref:Glutamate 5-kinase n=1 Tax=Lacipirellula limnantheis TaxID=2528024 RepID=A0A517U3W2_9BACT|nr:glutamate 5-kinase [Lacipirellula limnantheis]QDT75311.1 Glutamate 5-kinase [Lacipirellula limnantheis]